MGPLGSRPRCSVLVYAYLCKYATRIRAQGRFCSSNIQTLETSTFQKSRGSWPLFPDFNKNREDPVASRLPKYPPNCNEAKCFQNSKSATSMLLFQQWPGAFNKWGSFKCLPSFQANSYVRSQTTNNQRSSSKNSRLTDSRQKRAQKKHRSGGPLSTRSLFEGKKQRIERAAKTRTSWTHALHMSGKFYFWSNS